MEEAYIYEAVRTPRGAGKLSGALHPVTPITLATQVLQAIRERNELDTRLLDDVILGVVNPVGDQGSDIGRIAVLNAEYAESVAGMQINRFCSSGLDAVNMAAAQVMSGQSVGVIGGGVESMSRIPLGSSGGAWASDPKVALKTRFIPQGISADLCASLHGYSREDVDAFAVESQRRTAKAQAEDYYAKSLVPIMDDLGEVVLDCDEFPRPGTTMETLASLKPSFAGMGRDLGFDTIALERYPQVERIHHIHHAGNSSGIADGASGVLIGNKALGEIAGIKPRARIKGFTSMGSEPTIMLTGPSYVTEKLLNRLGMGTGDIDLFEVNEAFAVVVLRFMEALGVPHDKVNVNGGAIALGHPLGATGAMLLGTVLDELERRNQSTALITLCVGAGMGTATIIERF